MSAHFASVGDTFSGFIIFDSSNTVLQGNLDLDGAVISFGEGNFYGELVPISNGYLFDTGVLSGGFLGTDSHIAFEFHDMVNFFEVSDSKPSDENFVDFEYYQGRITHFSVSVPESGETMLLLVMSLMPLIAARIKRLA
jgi:hypothetical protein